MTRKSWKISFRPIDAFKDRTRTQAPEPEPGSGHHPCSRGDWCYGRRITVQDGKTVITPAQTPRAYCEPCTAHIRECLDQLPGAYVRLAGELGESSRRVDPVHVPFGPSLPLRENVDALMRLMAVTLCGWEARVRGQASLKQRDPRKPVHTAEAVMKAADTLSIHLSVLMALQPAPMSRAVSLHPGRHGKAATISDKDEELHGDREIVRLGVDHVVLMFDEMDGEAAGAEILRLHYRALAILGEAGQQAETLDGVPCRKCEDMALERAEPPSDPSQDVMWSQCASCRDQMSREDFTQWAALYAKWADSSGLTCARCLAGRCPECTYGGCACAEPGHAAA